MSSEYEFHSPLREGMVLYREISKKELAESSFVTRMSHICDYDKYIASHNYEENDAIKEPAVTGWLSTHSDLSYRTIENYKKSIRTFLRFYSVLTGKKTYVPPSFRTDDSYIPYIFTDEEMNTIYGFVDNYEAGAKNTLPHIDIEFPMVIRMLDSNGFRLNELITTKMTNVNLDDGFIKIINAKGNKQRIVPLESEMTELLRIYCKTMKLQENAPAYLFPRRKPTEPLRNIDITSRFRIVLVKAGIRKERSTKRYAREACVHCLRHRFTMKAIQQLMLNGISLEETVPYLSFYLGHNGIVETETYMKFLADFLPEELDKFSKFAVNFLPDESIWNDWM